MLAERPKLRSDLLISPQQSRIGPVLVVKDPSTGALFRFKEVESFVIQRLDGSTPVEIIQRGVEEHFGAPLPEPTLKRFLEQLERIGLLEGSQNPSGRSTRREVIRGSLLYLRFKALDPDKLFSRLERKVRFFFTPHFLVLSGVLLFLAIVTFFGHLNEIGQNLPRLYRWESLLLAWLTVLAVVTLHEFAHGLTCKHFGGEVREMGFMLIYFQPAFYCNVSDAWLFPQKSQRLWVTFAGAYFELFLWALATLAWRVTEPHTWLNFFALVVMVTSGIKTLFNLNPLIKLDGYYLLSDYLEIPNLRFKAFNYLKSRVGSLFGSINGEFADSTRRDHRIFLVYGLVAGIYSYLLLGYILGGFGRFLTHQYQGTGFIVFMGLMMMVFRNPLGRVLSKLRVPLKFSSDMRASLKPFLTTVFLVALLGIVFFGRMELKISGEFNVLPVHNADVRAQVEGRIVEVYVREGDRVRQGEPIARLDDSRYRTELVQIEAEIFERDAKLRMLKAGARPEEILLARKRLETAKTRREQARRQYEEAKEVQTARLAGARAAVEKAREQFEYAKGQLDRLRPLFGAGLVPRSELAEAQERVAVRAKELEQIEAELRMVLANDLAEFSKEVAMAEKEWDEAGAELNLLLAGPRKEEIEAIESELARLQARREYLERQLRLTKMVSPTSGVVTTPKVEEKVGEYLKEGDLVAEVHALETVVAEILVPEREIFDVRVGQEVILKARAYPEKSFLGTVTTIAPTAEQNDLLMDRIIRVSTVIENRSDLLKPDMTGQAKVYCGQRPIWQLLTRRLWRYIRVEFWSWW